MSRGGEAGTVAEAAEQFAAPGSVLVIRDETWLVTRVERATDGWSVDVQGLSELVRDSEATVSTALNEDRMEGRARQQSGWVYSDLVKGTVLENRHGWHHTIADVMVVVAQAVHRCGLPMLTAVVWGKASGSPGPGFNKAARYLGRQGEEEDDLVAWVRELNAVHATWSPGHP